MKLLNMFSKQMPDDFSFGGEVDESKAVVQELHDSVFYQKGVKVYVLRLDLIHPVISGNKWFKLKYHLCEAVCLKKQGIVTFGGAYSNHIVAAAYAAKISGLKSIGFIRGELSPKPSDAIQDALRYGMKIEYLSRNEYRTKTKTASTEYFSDEFPEFYILPEGGSGLAGEQGSAEILQIPNLEMFSHILCAVGTGTMFRGLKLTASQKQTVIGVNVLKGFYPINGNDNTTHQLSNAFILHDYHFGGYAKKTNELIDFMNQLYQKYRLPSDFVYTGKLFYAAMDLISKNHFKPGDEILLIHSGGLQGNRSLPGGTLAFEEQMVG